MVGFLEILGLLLLGLKLSETGPVADWSWWVVMSPFLAIAVLWSLLSMEG